MSPSRSMNTDLPSFSFQVSETSLPSTVSECSLMRARETSKCFPPTLNLTVSTIVATIYETTKAFRACFERRMLMFLSMFLQILCAIPALGSIAMYGNMIRAEVVVAGESETSGAKLSLITVTALPTYLLSLQLKLNRQRLVPVQMTQANTTRVFTYHERTWSSAAISKEYQLTFLFGILRHRRT